MLINAEQYAPLIIIATIIMSRATATPLHEAAAQDDVAQVTTLLAAGADANARDSQGNTPLHTAARYARNTIIHLLLQAGAQVNRINNAQQTALEYALLTTTTDGKLYCLLKVAPLLLEAGASISINDDCGQKLLRLAIGLKNDALTKELLNRGAPIQDDTSADEFSSNMPLLWDAQAVQRHYLLRNWAFVLEQALLAKTKPKPLPPELARLLRTFATEAEPRSEQEHWKCEADLDRRGLLGPRGYGH